MLACRKAQRIAALGGCKTSSTTLAPLSSTYAPLRTDCGGLQPRQHTGAAISAVSNWLFVWRRHIHPCIVGYLVPSGGLWAALSFQEARDARQTQQRGVDWIAQQMQQRRLTVCYTILLASDLQRGQRPENVQCSRSTDYRPSGASPPPLVVRMSISDDIAPYLHHRVISAFRGKEGGGLSACLTSRAPSSMIHCQ